jgi:threonine dehydrogenase-like Zn-dependent dehydrogenase
VPERLALAKAMGADVLVDARVASLSEAVMDETRGRGADSAFEAAGDCEGINEAIRSTKAGGSIALIGLSAKPDMPIDFDTVMTKELRLNGMRRSNHNTTAAMAMLSAGRIPTAVLTHRMGLDCAPQAFQMLAAHADGAGKIIIENL